MPATPSSVRIVNACGALLLALGCSTTPLGATPENLSKAQQHPGAEVYRRDCSTCHGQRGEGLASNPSVMGPGALATYARDPSTTSNPALQDLAEQQRKQSLPTGADVRGSFKTAADVHRYVSQQMPLPKSKAGSLSPEDYWAVVNFILLGHGVAVPAGGVNAANAASVPLK
jgi:mono/diheme cytochrome c family protein